MFNGLKYHFTKVIKHHEASSWCILTVPLIRIVFNKPQTRQESIIILYQIFLGRMQRQSNCIFVFNREQKLTSSKMLSIKMLSTDNRLAAKKL